jgi:hypothetical protein
LTNTHCTQVLCFFFNKQEMLLRTLQILASRGHNANNHSFGGGRVGGGGGGGGGGNRRKNSKLAGGLGGSGGDSGGGSGSVKSAMDFVWKQPLLPGRFSLSILVV